MFIFTPSAMAWTPTTAACAYASDVEEALRLSKIDQKEAALTMDIPESLLSEWLHCKKQISGSRLADLPEKFHEALRELQADRDGAVILKRDLVALLHGAAAMKTMLKASLRSASKLRRRA